MPTNDELAAAAAELDQIVVTAENLAARLRSWRDIPPGPALPGKPSLVTSDSTASAIQLEWSQGPGGPTDLYRVLCGDRIVETVSLAATFDGLDYAASYTVMVVAVGPAGECPSESRTVMTKPPDPPGELTVTSTTVTASTVTVAFTQGPGGPTDLYHATANGLTRQTNEPTGLTVTWDVLKADTDYALTLEARGPGGITAVEPWTAHTDPAPPPPPPQLPERFDDLRPYAQTVGCLTPPSKVVNGKLDVRAGDIVENITLNGYLNFLGRPVAIRNVWINCTNAWATMYGWSYGCDLMENVTIVGGSDACLQMTKTKMRNIRMVAAKGADGFKMKSGFDLEHFYVELKPATPPAEHADGGQSFDGSNIRLVDGLIACRNQCTSGLMIASDPGQLSNVLAEWILVTLPASERANIPFYFWKSTSGKNGVNVVARDLGADRGGGWNSGPVLNTINAQLTRVGWTS